jgi:hypothetical protein
VSNVPLVPLDTPVAMDKLGAWLDPLDANLTGTGACSAVMLLAPRMNDGRARVWGGVGMGRGAGGGVASRRACVLRCRGLLAEFLIAGSGNIDWRVPSMPRASSLAACTNVASSRAWAVAVS